MTKIGLIAGNKKFPLLFAEAARKKGYSVVAIAIKGDTSRRLCGLVDKVFWLALSDFSQTFEVFKKEGIKKAVMAGQISPRRLFSKEVQRNQALQQILGNIEDRRADSIFGAIADKLEESGIELMDSTSFVGDFLPEKGILTKKEPAFDLWEDVYFGLHLAKAIGFFDIGQTVAVKNKAVVAVEAMEGTDNLIRRAGRICRGGFTVVKASKPKQDARFDVPVVGFNTVKNMVSSGGRCLAIEAGKTLFIDREASLRLAEKRGLAIVAI